MKRRLFFITLIALFLSISIPSNVSAYTTGVNASGQTTYSFSYTGACESITLPAGKQYKLEAWGGAGSDFYGYSGGKGGYASGTTSLSSGQTVYVCVGSTATQDTGTRFNGAGDSLYLGRGGSTYGYGGVGGGATDFRLTSDTWNNTNGLRSRIVVAGGGGGANNRRDGYGAGNGGHGGGLQGGVGAYTGLDEMNYGIIIASPATQTTGGVATWVNHGYSVNSPYDLNYFAGKFGIAGYDSDNSSISFIDQFQGGGGGGYYGGAAAMHVGGGGGSGYVKGCSGCDTTYLANQGNITFSNISLIAGNTAMPSTSGGTETGHSGSGYARITVVNNTPTVTTSVSNTGTWVKNGAKLNISGTITDPDTQNWTVSYSLSSNTTPGAWTVCRSASSTRMGSGVGKEWGEDWVS